MTTEAIIHKYWRAIDDLTHYKQDALSDDAISLALRLAVQDAYDNAVNAYWYTHRGNEMSDQILEVYDLVSNAQKASTETALDLAVGAYLLAAGYISRLEKMQAEAKALITEIFTETGQTDAVTSAGKVAISAPSVSISYDAKAIDILLRDDADLALRLSPYRKVTERAGTLRITAGK